MAHLPDAKDLLTNQTRLTVESLGLGLSNHDAWSRLNGQGANRGLQ